MNGWRLGGIGCFIFAAALLVSGISTVVGAKVPIGDASGLGVSRLVGAFLPSVLVLAVGLWLFQKGNSR